MIYEVFFFFFFFLIRDHYKFRFHERQVIRMPGDRLVYIIIKGTLTTKSIIFEPVIVGPG